MPLRWATDKMSGKSRSDSSTTDRTDFHCGGYEDCDQTKNFDCQRVHPTAQGGDYELCWCFWVGASGCGSNHLMRDRTCAGDRPCSPSDGTRHLLEDGDRIMNLDECGEVEEVQLLPMSLVRVTLAASVVESYN